MAKQDMLTDCFFKKKINMHTNCTYSKASTFFLFETFSRPKQIKHGKKTAPPEPAAPGGRQWVAPVAMASSSRAKAQGLLPLEWFQETGRKQPNMEE